MLLLHKAGFIFRLQGQHFLVKSDGEPGPGVKQGGDQGDDPEKYRVLFVQPEIYAVLDHPEKPYDDPSG